MLSKKSLAGYGAGRYFWGEERDFEDCENTYRRRRKIPYTGHGMAMVRHQKDYLELDHQMLNVFVDGLELRDVKSQNPTPEMLITKLSTLQRERILRSIGLERVLRAIPGATQTQIYHSELH